MLIRARPSWANRQRIRVKFAKAWELERQGPLAKSSLPNPALAQISSRPAIPILLPKSYSVSMSLGCLFGRHRPMLTSIMKRENGYAALCDGCGLPIERSEDGAWSIAKPLLARQDRAA